MLETGRTWRLMFKALPAEAHAVRTWTSKRTERTDAVHVANELFTAVLASSPHSIEMTISTAGPRIRITATGTIPLLVLHSHGPGYRIVARLAAATGITEDSRGLWAQLKEEPIL